MTVFETVRYEVDGEVATLTLNRPAGVNALDAAMAGEIAQVLGEIDRDRAVRALLVTGAGSTFCVGSDRRDKLSSSGAASGDTWPALDIPAALRAARVPVVIAINGPAVDGGCDLALSGDILLAADSAELASGEVLSADQACERGLINECLPGSALLPRARALAATLAKGPTRALVATRGLVDEGADNSFRAQYRRELEENQELRGSPDGLEGVQAFLDKRPARFRGE